MAGFSKAIKQQARLRLALVGPAGSGKTYSALNIGQYLGERLALIDTEHGSASKYADVFQFDTLQLDNYHPQHYIDAIAMAEAAGYDVLVIDSLSHAWSGKGGALELVDRAAKKSQSNNTFAAWRDITPLQNALVDKILAAKLHIIATMRAKTEYLMEKNERTGKTEPRKVGLAPVQRDQIEYEFDVIGDLTVENDLVIGKTRCPALQGVVINRAGPEIAETLRGWLEDGASEPANPSRLPLTTQEAEQRFWTRFMGPLGGADWERVVRLLGTNPDVPMTVSGWIELGKLVNAALEQEAQRAA